MKTFFSLISILFSGFIFCSAQDVKVKFGKISPTDLAMTVYAPDPDATAVILSKVGWVRYDALQEKYALSEENHVVIKILKETGIDEYGNVEIDYYSYNNYSKVGNIKAVVHLPDGTDIKVDNSQIFDVKNNDYWSTKKIAFPKLVTGAIIEYQYIILSDGMFHPIDWFFQGPIPIVYAELVTKIPAWFDYIVLTQGLPLDSKKKEETDETLSISSVSRGGAGFSGVSLSQINQGSTVVKFINNTYINKEVPALKEECCITTMEDYYSRVRYQLKAFIYPDGSREPVMNSWTKLAEELYLLPEWGGQLRNKRPGEVALEAMGITPSPLQMETAKKIYDYINDNIRWNEFYSFYSTQDLNSILKQKSGNSGDLNKLMCAALLQSGINAKPVLLSTRSNGKPLELYPFTDQFNHMVVLATIDGKDTWIDAGDKNLPLGTIRAEALNTKGWVVDEANPIWMDIKQVDSKSVYLIKGSIDADGNLNGELECRFTGYHAVNHRMHAEEAKEKFGEELIGSGTIPVKISDVELINANDPSLAFQLKAKVVNHPVATVTADKLYITPVFPKGLDVNPFKLDTRIYPIEINYPEEVSMILSLSLPEGYVVESVPDPIRYVTESGGVQVSYEAMQSAGKLSVTMKYVIKQLLFTSEEYPTLKNFYDQRNQKFNEQIVLTKA